MATRATSPSPASNPLPIQFTVFRKEDLQSDAGVARLNLLFAQYTPIINALFGTSGPTLLPSGVDVQGAQVTGLAAPKNESDAVSLGHAQGNYGPAAQQPQLDIGGDHALKGLSALYLNAANVVNPAVARVPPTNYAGGGFFTIFGLVLQFGLIANMDTAVFPMNFPIAFPHACQALVALTTGPNDRIVYSPTLASTTQFSLANNGTGAGAYWIALGW